jgi:hypothetical protein
MQQQTSCDCFKCLNRPARCQPCSSIIYAGQQSQVPFTNPAAGQQSEVPSAVDIRYFTANGITVTRKQREASGADTGSNADKALSNDGSQVVWDQALLAAHPTCFVFSPESPQLSVSSVSGSHLKKEIACSCFVSPPDSPQLSVSPVSRSNL